MKSLIFDIDGTLWDSREIVARGYNDYLREIGRADLQVDAEYLKTLFGKTMTEIADIMLAGMRSWAAAWSGRTNSSTMTPATSPSPA